MLSPSAVSNAKPRSEPYKLADERGMYLLVRKDGSRWWRFDYRRPDTRKRNTLSLGNWVVLNNLNQDPTPQPAAKEVLNGDRYDPEDRLRVWASLLSRLP